MLDEKNISIIIPVYNAEKYLDRCIQSLMEYKDGDEVILVNDGSTDSSKAICERYASTHKGFKLVNQANGGVSSARNMGIKNSQRDWIMFVDADDYLKEGWRIILENSIEQFGGKSDVLIFSGTIESKSYSQDECIKAAFGFNNSLGSSLGFPVSKLFRKKVISENKISFSDKLINGEDMIFNANIYAASFHIMGIQKSFYQYYKNMESATNRFNAKIVETEHVFHDEMKKLFLAYGKTDDEWNRIYTASLLTGLYAMAYRIALSTEPNEIILQNIIKEKEYKQALEALDKYVDFGISKKKLAVLNRLKKGKVSQAIAITKVYCFIKRLYYRNKNEGITVLI